MVAQVKFNKWLIERGHADRLNNMYAVSEDGVDIMIEPTDEQLIYHKWLYLWHHMNMDDIVEMQVSRNFDADDINMILDRYIDKIEDIDIGPLTTTMEAV